MPQDLHVCSIDYKKAFDHLKHEIVLKKLREVGTDDKNLRIVQNLYYEQEASVQIGNRNGDSPNQKGCITGMLSFTEFV